jgi:hypothetical protein
MNVRLTHLALIIDRSGSMSGLQLETIETINRVVRTQVSEVGEDVDVAADVFNTAVDIDKAFKVRRGRARG